MSKHTPAPWTVGRYAMSVEGQTSKGTMKICDIRGWGHLTGQGHGALGLDQDEALKIQTANAHLIAAAPELLAALQEVVAVFDSNPPSITDTVWVTGNSPQTLYDLCCAVIEKATAEVSDE